MLLVMNGKDSLGARIASARTKGVVRKTQAELASALGVTPQAVSGWERNESRPDVDKLSKLADELGVAMTWLLQGGGPEVVHDYLLETQATLLKDIADRPRSERRVPGRVLVGAQDFPIHAAAQAGDGEMLISTDVMEYVRRPSILEGVIEGYGIYVVGTSMIPAYRPGDMALVHPRRGPGPDTDVIIYAHDPRSGETRAMIKHLASFSHTAWKLEQYSPLKTFSLSREEWPICHRVVGKYNARS